MNKSGAGNRLREYSRQRLRQMPLDQGHQNIITPGQDIVDFSRATHNPVLNRTGDRIETVKFQGPGQLLPMPRRAAPDQPVSLGGKDPRTKWSFEIWNRFSSRISPWASTSQT